MKVKKLLWIDDMEHWASSAARNLEMIASKYGVNLKVIWAVNGEEVLQILMQYDFDGVIMDFHMEPFNGDKYIQDIRNEDHLQHIPIIFYSQDNSADLSALVKNLRGVTTVYRPNLEDNIKELFFGE